MAQKNRETQPHSRKAEIAYHRTLPSEKTEELVGSGGPVKLRTRPSVAYAHDGNEKAQSEKHTEENRGKRSGAH